MIFSHDPAQKQAENQLGSGWEKAQEDLKKLSQRSRRIIAKGSGHYIQFDRPDLIEKEVQLFVEQIRGKAPFPPDDRATVAE
ncbi:hypothetical protein ACOBR2_07085 [Telmatobacter bradus]|uniref:hypothetical protein n=1 Tax=Telmatobacter bradus TaxID=474953 RepID=UPI003B42E422